MSASKVKLVWNGPDSTVNLDVAAETGDGQLVPGRQIEVTAELGELLLRSSVHWSGESPLEQMKLAELRAAAAAAGVDNPDALKSKKAAIAAIEAAKAATPDPDGAAGAEES